MEQPASPAWRRLDLSNLENRLFEVKRLLEQAAALAAAADAERVAAIARQGVRQAEAADGNPQRRRYR